MKLLVTRQTLFILLTLVGSGAHLSCQRKIGVDMKAIGDPNAAENRKPPVVVVVSSTEADGKYVTGDTIDIIVRFSKPVHVGGAGQIGLALATGSAARSAAYGSGSDSDTLHLSYQVQSGDQSEDLQYTDTGALSCSMDTTIRDDVDNDAVLTLPELASAMSLGGQKHLMINPTSAFVDQDSGKYDDLGLHFEKSTYQTRSIKRLLIKESEVSGLTSATVLVNKSSFECTVNSSYDSVLASLEPAMAVILNTALRAAVYGTAQTVTLALEGAGITPNETTEQITLKDFNISAMGSAALDGSTQIKDGYQGWIGPMMGVGTAIGGETSLISGYFNAINR